MSSIIPRYAKQTPGPSSSSFNFGVELVASVVMHVTLLCHEHMQMCNASCSPCGMTTINLNICAGLPAASIAHQEDGHSLKVLGLPDAA